MKNAAGDDDMTLHDPPRGRGTPECWRSDVFVNLGGEEGPWVSVADIVEVKTDRLPSAPPQACGPTVTRVVFRHGGYAKTLLTVAEVMRRIVAAL